VQSWTTRGRAAARATPLAGVVQEVLPAALDQWWWMGLGRVGLGRDDPRSLDRGGFLPPPVDKPRSFDRGGSAAFPSSRCVSAGFGGARPCAAISVCTAGHGRRLGSERQIMQVAGGWHGPASSVCIKEVVLGFHLAPR
jgi:hypothetical protein